MGGTEFGEPGDPGVAVVWSLLECLAEQGRCGVVFVDRGGDGEVERSVRSLFSCFWRHLRATIARLRTIAASRFPGNDVQQIDERSCVVEWCRKSVQEDIGFGPGKVQQR